MTEGIQTFADCPDREIGKYLYKGAEICNGKTVHLLCNRTIEEGKCPRGFQR